ncbi:MAG: sigma-70 family RNA polymerase sigma factor [Bacteroidia bacterium]|nr:sigma-70 family RNA polymerase sigma factor [Bacteroidia bacterium]
MEPSLYQSYRTLLMPIARNILGSGADAEDMVQETLLKWVSRPEAEIGNIRGYLVKTLINKCLNLIRDQKNARKKQHFLLTEEVEEQMSQRVEQGPVLSLGVLAMLEKLSPSERAVFLLKEVFGYSHREIADLLGISEDNCRQILARARRHIQGSTARFTVDPARHLRLYQTFVEVCEGNDLGKLLEILREDIELEVMRPAARLSGALVVAEHLLQVHRQGLRYEWGWLRGMPALVAWLYSQPVRVYRLTSDGSEIYKIEVEDLVPDSVLLPRLT